MSGCEWLLRGTGFPSAVMKVSDVDCADGCSHRSTRKTTDSCALRGWILQYVNYISAERLEMMEEIGCGAYGNSVYCLLIFSVIPGLLTIKCNIHLKAHATPALWFSTALQRRGSAGKEVPDSSRKEAAFRLPQHLLPCMAASPSALTTRHSECRNVTGCHLGLCEVEDTRGQSPKVGS